MRVLTFINFWAMGSHLSEKTFIDFKRTKSSTFRIGTISVDKWDTIDAENALYRNNAMKIPSKKTTLKDVDDGGMLQLILLVAETVHKGESWENARSAKLSIPFFAPMLTMTQIEMISTTQAKKHASQRERRKPDHVISGRAEE